MILRIAAAGFSASLLFPLCLLSNMLLTLGWADPWFGRLNSIHPWITGVVIIYVIVALPAVCNAGFSVWRRATLGMWIENTTFRACPAGRIGALRCYLRVIAGVLLVPLLPVSIAIMLTDRYKRSLADVICGTTVRVIHAKRLGGRRIRSRKNRGPMPDAADSPISEPLFCDNCGYCLTALQDARCPECGEPFNPALLDP